MRRLSITLSDVMHAQLSSIALQNKDSISNVMTYLSELGLKYLELKQKEPISIEKHCQQLIIQMNAMIQSLSVEILKFNQDDFEQLRTAMIVKYNELTMNDESGY